MEAGGALGEHPHRRFSALQRAENSSIQSSPSRWKPPSKVSVLFSEPKIPQSSARACSRLNPARVSVLFSEPKIPQSIQFDIINLHRRVFQCSSASRKFLNLHSRLSVAGRSEVSVLFSEPKIPQCWGETRPGGSAGWFQCSSASRKFLNSPRCALVTARSCVSVLFSEPKIPQCAARCPRHADRRGFSALQRAENSSIQRALAPTRGDLAFQCSSASRKFLNRASAAAVADARRFQCSSASRKFLNRFGIWRCRAR